MSRQSTFFTDIKHPLLKRIWARHHQYWMKSCNWPEKCDHCLLQLECSFCEDKEHLYVDMLKHIEDSHCDRPLFSQIFTYKQRFLR